MVKIVCLVMLACSLAHADVETNALDPDSAQRMSVIGSAVPIAIVGIGTLVAAEGTNAPVRDVGAVMAVGGVLAGIVTPSIGSFFARRWLDPGIALRTGGVVVEAIGFVTAFNKEIGDCSDFGPCHHPASTYGLLVAGAALYLGGMALDIVGAPQAARDWNARHQLRVVPTAVKTLSTTTTGVAVALTF